MDLEAHTEWSKSEREKQISYINTYIWNLENWHKSSYLQSKNRDTGVKNKYMDTKGEGGLGGMNWKVGINVYTLTVYKIDN